MKINLLLNKIPWFGNHAGYECLVNYIDSDGSIKTITNTNSSIQRILGKIIKELFSIKNYSSCEVAAGYKFYLYSNRHKISHLLYLESHRYLCHTRLSNSSNFISTLHLPYSQWSSSDLSSLSRLRNIIILYEEDIDLFQSHAPNTRFHFIHYGVDTNFFKPNRNLQLKGRILFVGHYLRDFCMLKLVWERLYLSYGDAIELNMVIGKPFIASADVYMIKNLPGVTLHSGISDEQLLFLYQSSEIMLMPMLDSGANTGIVQAISCGLPIVTNVCGGIRSYGGGKIYPICRMGDVEGFVDLCACYLNDNLYRDKVSIDIRNFAKENLDWRLVASKHEELYKKILNSN